MNRGNVGASDHTQDEYFMKLALDASRGALPGCIPNPPVGCVLVRKNELISTGFTHPPGGFHAEAHALSQVIGDLDDVTAYVTLEPCAFRGRAPSCAISMLERKLKAVVVALVDPDPRNNGKGVELLRAGGIEVRVGVLAETVSAFISPYLNMPANHSVNCGAHV